MIDTHSHLLPGVDHGSPDLGTTLRMAREAAAVGVRTVVCTPHLYEFDERLVERAADVLEEVRAALAREGLDLRLLLGFETGADLAATTDIEALRSLCVEGSGGGESAGMLLIEMPFHGWPLYLEETIFRLSAEGFIPVLAHPERNDRVQRDPDVLKRCLDAGAVAQATAGSLSPMFRKDSLRALHALLARGWYSLLASDAHADTEYTWTPAPMLAELGGRVPADTLTRLTEENGARVIIGERPLRVAPADVGTRTGIYSRAPWRKTR
jgi:protein-tyrosine phosphatase